MATRKIGTRGKPTSPLHLGVSDPEHILKEDTQLRKYHSYPSLFTPEHLKLKSPFAYLEEEKQNLSWLIPSILVETFQNFINPWSYKK